MFPNTEWTQLAQATLHGESSGRAALESLCRSYWEPVRMYALFRGPASALGGIESDAVHAGAYAAASVFHGTFSAGNAVRRLRPTA